MKGQVSIEALIILIVVISFAIFVGNIFFQEQITTQNYGIIRSSLLKQTNEKDTTILIEKIYKIDNNYIIQTNPKLTNLDFNIEKIKNKLINNSTKINIVFNP